MHEVVTIVFWILCLLIFLDFFNERPRVTRVSWFLLGAVVLLGIFTFPLTALVPH